MTMLHQPHAFTEVPSAATPNLPVCRVLVVDDDAACLDEYCEIVEALGYSCVKAQHVSVALRLLAEDSTIGIVLTDLQMPTMDGFTLLEEISARFTALRPLVAVVITGQANVDSAIRAMRSNAIDFLPKPVVPDDLSAVLRRAALRWSRQVGQFRLMELARAGDQIAQVNAIASNAPHDPGPAGTKTPTTEELVTFVRSIMRSRRRRSDFLDTNLFADPAWDILLELTSAGLMQTPVPTSSACAAAQVPLSTALRHVRHLVDSGLVKRWQDRNDKRRTLLALEGNVMESMKKYLVAVWRRDSVTPL